MPNIPLLSRLKAALETPRAERPFGSGWLSGSGALLSAIVGLFLVVCLRYPEFLATPALDMVRASGWFRTVLHIILILAYSWALLSLILRPQKTLGFWAMAIAIAATLLGGSQAEAVVPGHGSVFFGLDFFVLNVLFTGFLFIPLERFAPHNGEQTVFRTEWREDIFYYLVSSLFVQVLTFLTLAPSQTIVAHTQWTDFRAAVGGQPWLLQVVEIMLLTDLAQYWLHRAFHRVPFLWGFHAVHHSAQTMDWIAGARMHFLEIIVLRSATAIPMMTLGYEPAALQAYLAFVYIYSAFIHANVGWKLDWLSGWFVTPRYHHWHHGLEPEAIDVNFAIHFPLFDRLFGTHHLPEGKWPAGYGVGGHPVPRGWWPQFLYPFRK